MFRISICLLFLAGSQAAIACQQMHSANSDFPDSARQINNPVDNTIASAWYDGATDRYAHGVLGDAIEPSILRVTNTDNCTISIVLDEDHVFEDIAPRLANIDKKPGAEIITVRSHKNKGAQIAIYQLSGTGKLQLLTSTPFIGTANRWLAPVGIADFDNDGNTDIAYVDRPHLAKILRVWSYQNGKLMQIANKHGYSNHRIGEDYISGGIRNCDDGISMITADANWRQVLKTRLIDGQLLSKKVASFEDRNSLDAATECD